MSKKSITKRDINGKKFKVTSNPYYYKDVAKSLGVKHLVGRWGISFRSNLTKKWRIRFIPLDNWTTDSKGIAAEMKKRDFKL